MTEEILQGSNKVSSSPQKLLSKLAFKMLQAALSFLLQLTKLQQWNLSSFF